MEKYIEDLAANDEAEDDDWQPNKEGSLLLPYQRNELCSAEITLGYPKLHIPARRLTFWHRGIDEIY